MLFFIHIKQSVQTRIRIITCWLNGRPCFQTKMKNTYSKVFFFNSAIKVFISNNSDPLIAKMLILLARQLANNQNLPPKIRLINCINGVDIWSFYSEGPWFEPRSRRFYFTFLNLFKDLYVFIFSHFRTEYVVPGRSLSVCADVCVCVCLSGSLISTIFVRFWWKCTQMILTKIWDDTFFIFSNFCLMTS